MTLLAMALMLLGSLAFGAGFILQATWPLLTGFILVPAALLLPALYGQPAVRKG